MKDHNTIRIGLTGGIGSGKSYVSRFFRTLNIPIYYADIEAQRLMKTHPDIIKGLTSLCGSEVYWANGDINKELLRNMIFEHTDMREKINQIIHPVIGRDVIIWFNQQDTHYAIEEAAILIESGNHKIMDKIIVVEAKENIVIERIIQRDSITAEQARLRINAQLDSKTRRTFADYIIYNNGEPIATQIFKIHSSLLKTKVKR